MINLQLDRRSFLTKTSLIALGSVGLPGVVYSDNQKKIALIGDSIRLGYQGYVALYLMDQAEIWTPDNMSINTIDILQEAHSWFKQRMTHIIHINSGLVDIKCIPYQSHNNLIPLEHYIDNIERIIKYIHQYQPDSVIIWGTTTPVIDSRVKSFYSDSNDFMIYNEDIIRYNEAGKKVMERLGVPINDLYTFVISGGTERIMLEDGIHFTETGYEFLGEQVAEALRIFL